MTKAENGRKWPKSPLRLLFVLFAALILAACATTGTPRVETQVVNVPVPVQCNPQLGPEPNYPDTAQALQAAPDIFEATKLVLAGRLLRNARLAELQAALAACRGAP